MKKYAGDNEAAMKDFQSAGKLGKTSFIPMRLESTRLEFLFN